MDVTINALSDVQQEAEIRLSNEELRPRFEHAYAEYRPKVELRGFRKGKVPLELVKRMFGEAIEREALDTIATEVYQQAMDERKIHPIGQPALVTMDFKRGQHLSFKIKYEVKPAIPLKSYKGIAVERPVHTVTDKDLQEEIEHLRRTNSTLTEVPRVTDSEHLVTADVQELDEAGAPLIGKKTPGMRFLLSDATIAEEIRNALAAAEKGGTYRTSFESKHEGHAHKVHLSITATKIEKVHLPDFNDAFVEKITGGKTKGVTEFTAKMKSDLEQYWEDRGTRAVSDALADEVVRMHEFIVPEAMVETILDSFLEDIRNRSRDRRLPRDFDERKFRDENRALAVWQSKWMLLKERIAEAEHLTVTDEEIEKLAADEAAKSGLAKERVLQYYKSSGSVRERLLADKIMALLKSSAKINERAV